MSLFTDDYWRLNTVWCGLEQRIVDDAIEQWRRRLLACVDAESQHFEHNLVL